jgi:chemotaxis protein methyltransferase CheR
MAFVEDNDHVRLRSDMREGIEFLQQDVRDAAPAGRFDLILCRNLAFTYFETPQQREVLDRLAGKLNASGFLVLGSHETLPPGRVDFEQPCGSLPIWKHIAAPST